LVFWTTEFNYWRPVSCSKKPLLTFYQSVHSLIDEQSQFFVPVMVTLKMNRVKSDSQQCSIKLPRQGQTGLGAAAPSSPVLIADQNGELDGELRS